MEKYNTVFLLRDCNNDNVDAIFLTSESAETIQQAIYKAKSEYYELEQNGSTPDYINCEFEYIYSYLNENFDVEFLDNLYNASVYY